MSSTLAHLHTSSGKHRLCMKVAGRWWERLRGLLFSHPLRSPWQSGPMHHTECEGLLLTPCNSVHGIGMSHALEIAYLVRQSDGWEVVRLTRLSPWTVSIHWGSTATLELPEGSIAAMKLEPGDRLECCDA